MKPWRIRTVGAFLLTLAGAAALAAAPPARVQDGWLAWQGCWRASDDPADRMVCIIPDGNAARMLELSSGKVQSETRIYTDGVARPITREGCTGTEQARWSEDQQRLFTIADMKCGESMHRKVTGVMSMKSATEWLSVQAVTTSGQAVARTLHYRAVMPRDVPAELVASLTGNGLATETARYAASQAVDLTDVTEAVHAVDEQVVVDWLTALAQPFYLTGRKLISLADSGVPASVIDVLVAVSNPERFAVRTTTRRDEDPYWARGGGRVYDPCWGYASARYLPYGYGYGYGYGGYDYGGYGYRSRYGYGCGFTPWGYDPWGWSPVGRTIIVVRGSTEDDNARVTPGGYTSSTTKGKAKPRGTPVGTSVGTSDARPTTTSTARPTVSGSGYGSGSSGSSSGSSTGHTAKPRDKDK